MHLFSMLSTKQLTFLRSELETAQNPMYLFDNDADGLCAYLVLYRFCKEGRGVIFKSARKDVDVDFLHKVEELNPDKIFVLDIADINQEFIDRAKRPIFWIDHHPLQERSGVHYFNPLAIDPTSYIPTTQLAYMVTQRKEDLWIATVGALADYAIPDFLDEFIALYPQYLPKRGDIATMLFHERVGELVKFFSFMLKGQTNDVRRSVKILTRINSPDEIFNETSPAGKFLHKRYEKINQMYLSLLESAKKQVSSSPLLVFYYSETQWSFTSNLATELAGLYPKKVVIIARRRGGELKCSIRAQFPIIEMLQRSFIGLNARGGGHPNACGAVVSDEDWNVFLETFKRELKEERATR